MKAISLANKSMNLEFAVEAQDFGTDSKEYIRNLKIIERFMNGFFKQGTTTPLLLEVEQAVNEIDYIGKNHQLYLDAKDILREIYTHNITTAITDSKILVDQLNSFLNLQEAFLSIGEQIFVTFELNYLIFKSYKNFSDFIFSVIKRITNSNRNATLMLINDIIRQLNELKSRDLATQAELKLTLEKVFGQKSDLKNLIHFIQQAGIYDDLVREYLSNSSAGWSEYLRLQTQNKASLIEQMNFIFAHEVAVSERFFPGSVPLIKKEFATFFVQSYLKSLLENFAVSVTAKDYETSKKILYYFELAASLKVLKTHIIHVEKQRLLACTSFQSIINFLKHLFDWTNILFCNFPEIQSEIVLDIQKSVNADKEISPPLFASALDSDIHNNSAQQKQTFIKLFELLNEKEGYLKEVYKFFCKAIILNKNAKSYLDLLQDLKRIYGEETLAQFTDFLEQIEEGRELSSHLPPQMADKISLTVVGSTAWPHEVLQDSQWLNCMPIEFAQAAHDLTDKYSHINRLKQLTLQKKYSTAEVDCRIGNIEFSLVCKVNYLGLIMQFNKSTTYDILMLASMLKINPEKLRKMLQKLHLHIKAFTVDEVFAKFESQHAQNLTGKRIDLTEKTKLPSGLEEETIQKSAINEERKEDFIRSREKQIKAYIARRVKKEDKVPIPLILDALKGELNVEVVHSDISSMIDDLVNSEIIKRSDHDTNVLQYKK